MSLASYLGVRGLCVFTSYWQIIFL
uniref:Uncharacterized protein n=1 Tax=Anguilla anguilla TaxID=7936 RepID=A0A0E9Q6A7_ANGAN